LQEHHHVAIAVTIVGSADRSLEERLVSAGMRPVSVPATYLATLTHPSSTPPDVVVVDLRTQPQIPTALGLVRRQHPDTGLIIVASTLDPALMLDAMRAGVTECVTDISRGDLEAAITRLATQKLAPEAGDVFVFTGAKGGVGTTTIAVNVATALAKIGGPGSTLFIDLHVAGGDAALYFGAEPRFSVIDALENTHRLDASYFRGLVEKIKSGPELLASTDRAAATTIDPPRVRTLIECAARNYRYTVVDIPRSDLAVLDALESVTRIIVVANQELATVRGAGRYVSVLRMRYGKDKISVILSRGDRHAEIALEDLERAVGMPVKQTFPSDYRLALDALNRGRPLVIESSSPLATGLQRYARELAGVTAQAEPETKAPTGLLGRLTGRRS
jgi:pilus assembly protein CpaE